MGTEFPQNPFRSTVDVVDKLVDLNFSNDVKEANKSIVGVLEPEIVEEKGEERKEEDGRGEE